MCETPNFRSAAVVGGLSRTQGRAQTILPAGAEAVEEAAEEAVEGDQEEAEVGVWDGVGR